MDPALWPEVTARLAAAHPQHEVPCFVEELVAHNVFFDHASFLAFYHKIDTDFVYDARSGVYLAGIVKEHVAVMAALYCFYSGDVTLDKYVAADRYVEESFGVFKSRAGHTILCSKDFVLPTEYKRIMRDIERLS